MYSSSCPGKTQGGFQEVRTSEAEVPVDPQVLALCLVSVHLCSSATAVGLTVLISLWKEGEVSEAMVTFLGARVSVAVHLSLRHLRTCLS